MLPGSSTSVEAVPKVPAFGVPGVAEATAMPSSVAAEATAISAAIRIRCFHSRSARRTAQRDSERRAIAARRGSSGSRAGRSSRA